jgi:FHS family L-fucose permease-like MFS transporter
LGVAGNGSGLLTISIVGGAILPVVQGAMADHIGMHHAFLLPVLCYADSLFYAVSGSKPNRERGANAQGGCSIGDAKQA